MTDTAWPYLLLKDDFFESDRIKFIEEQGAPYIIFYLKLCLKTLKDGGNLTGFLNDDSEGFDFQALSELTNMPMETVTEAVQLLSKIGFIESEEHDSCRLMAIKEVRYGR
ncbi:phage replisome organizer N-terminal domain-containing protein [Aerococcus sp. UMB1112A]|uniref:phage replisome organizer N-terminal domain-containing protein n=1 Tax=Aerococcus sp. UMB1112A TaxID=3050609 RepID=UPI00254C1097|nr:phage replisome organizer N-terminal domain-containing protein [Aerococcus sp. UMB1112A]MDK8502111.1 phage replisome organizer N-terminal domain-containing protein [Aerococcus sp. UMB1112A]